MQSGPLCVLLSLLKRLTEQALNFANNRQSWGNNSKLFKQIALEKQVLLSRSLVQKQLITSWVPCSQPAAQIPVQGRSPMMLSQLALLSGSSLVHSFDSVSLLKSFFIDWGAFKPTLSRRYELFFVWGFFGTKALYPGAISFWRALPCQVEGLDMTPWGLVFQAETCLQPLSPDNLLKPGKSKESKACNPQC